jgi:hypothetical protein
MSGLPKKRTRHEWGLPTYPQRIIALYAPSDRALGGIPGKRAPTPRRQSWSRGDARGESWSWQGDSRAAEETHDAPELAADAL